MDVALSLQLRQLQPGWAGTDHDKSVFLYLNSLVKCD
jgi:hypothetical protein